MTEEVSVQIVVLQTVCAVILLIVFILMTIENYNHGRW